MKRDIRQHEADTGTETNTETNTEINTETNTRNKHAKQTHKIEARTQFGNSLPKEDGTPPPAALAISLVPQQ